MSWGERMIGWFRGDYPKPDELSERLDRASMAHSIIQQDTVRTLLDGVDRTEHVRATVRGVLHRVERKNAHG